MEDINDQEEDKLIEMNNRGHEIAAHGYDHLNVLDYLQTHTEQEFINSEILPLLNYFSNLSINISSYAYPWGERNSQTDALLLNHFQFLRGTSDPGGVEVKDNELCFIHPDNIQNNLIYGVEIDIIYNNDFDELSEAILKAKNEGLVVVFYAHKPLENPSGYQISPTFIESVLNYTVSLGMQFYTVSDINMLRDQSLSVGLLSFTATAGKGQIVLEWATASELENLGFEIFRSVEEDRGYQLLDSYKYNDDLIGAGSSADENHYSYIDNFIVNGTTYWYKLIDVDLRDKRTEHGPIFEFVHYSVTDELPLHFIVQQNSPNPFNPRTTIRFNILDQNGSLTDVNLTIFDLLGKKVKTLVGRSFSDGRYQVDWDAKDDAGLEIPSGIYIYRFRAGDHSDSKSMMLLK